MSVEVVTLSPAESATIEAFSILLGSMMKDEDQSSKMRKNLSHLRDRYVAAGNAPGVAVIEEITRTVPALKTGEDK